MMKKQHFAIGLICVGLIAIVAGIIVTVTHPSGYSTTIPEGLDEAVVRSIFTSANVSPTDTTIDGTSYRYIALTDNDQFYESECFGEGHVILGCGKKEGMTEVYALCSTSGYGFRNGILVDNTGSSCVPTLFRFVEAGNGEYLLKEAIEAEDGAYFAPSIRKMFPAALAEKAISAQSDDEIHASLSQQCDEYAKAYLKVLGREAKISSYREEDFRMLNDYGVDAEVENALYALHPEYGFYVGSSEKLKSDGRYVYSLVWDGDDSGNGTVTYSQARYDSGETVEKSAYTVKGNQFTELKEKKAKKKK